MTAKHAQRGTMAALAQLGLGKKEAVTVDDVARKIEEGKSKTGHNSNPSNQTVHEIDPSLVTNWKFHDRPTQELGNLETFAQELKAVGQQQPCIVRPIVGNSNFKYEVIAGERRWRASLLAKIKLKVIVTELSDNDAALVQASENSNRKDLSEYARGISYSKLIEQGLLSRTDLQTKLNISKSSVRDLLSFSRITKEVLDNIHDKTKLTANLAYEMTRIQENGPDYIAALIKLAPKLSGQKIGVRKLHLLLDKLIALNSSRVVNASEVTTHDGRHIFTWRSDTNGHRSIAFPKGIRSIIDFSELESCIKENIEDQLCKLKTE
jgi:ParB family transcriptional regulator, chromosome partitioning protein